MPLTHFGHKRIVGIEVKCKDANMLMICVYMPFYNSSCRAECTAETIDAITMIDNILEQHPSHTVVIGGDLNTELKGNSPFDKYWLDFMNKNDLACCDHLFPADSFTYHHKGLDQKKWNDHFIISKKLMERKISNFSIPDDGDNISDHLPIMMNMILDIKDIPNEPVSSRRNPVLKWEKINPSHMDAY